MYAQVKLKLVLQEHFDLGHHDNMQHISAHIYQLYAAETKN